MPQDQDYLKKEIKYYICRNMDPFSGVIVREEISAYSRA
jgi:hypothetical protein